MTLPLHASDPGHLAMLHPIEALKIFPRIVSDRAQDCPGPQVINSYRVGVWLVKVALVLVIQKGANIGPGSQGIRDRPIRVQNLVRIGKLVYLIGSVDAPGATIKAGVPAHSRNGGISSRRDTIGDLRPIPEDPGPLPRIGAEEGIPRGHEDHLGPVGGRRPPRSNQLRALEGLLVHYSTTLTVTRSQRPEGCPTTHSPTL